MIDIDFFKLYNDNYGHMAGDQVLKQVAQMLLDSVRSNDIVIRYGGEEFLVLLTKVTDPIAQSICSRILQKLEKLQIPHKASKISDHITVSIGMCYQEEKNTFSLRCGSRSVHLSRKEFDLLELLMRNRETVLTKETLLLKIWGYESDAEDNNVEVYISFLRKKLSHLHSQVRIKTIRMVGYCLEYTPSPNP